MTKAEKIFKDTKYTCYKSYKAWGPETNPNGKPVGFTSLTYGDDEFVCTRTLNDVQKEINRAKRFLELDVKLNVITSEKAAEEKFILDMVQVTLDNHKDAIKRLNG